MDGKVLLQRLVKAHKGCMSFNVVWGLVLLEKAYLIWGKLSTRLVTRNRIDPSGRGVHGGGFKAGIEIYSAGESYQKPLLGIRKVHWHGI